MPVDHPASPVGAMRPVQVRTLTFALSFLLTLGLLMALAPVILGTSPFN